MSQFYTQTYKYGVLPEHDSIRLILLQPSISHEADVLCFLHPTTLSQCDFEVIDHYTALSYVWGDATQTALISVDGEPFTITATLAAALRDLRDEKRVVRLWADALCINQLDTDERNSQVAMMGRIYSLAQHTIIYLGPLTSNAEEVFRSVISWNYENIGSLVAKAEEGILDKPWFSRVWIFQELILSRDPWAQCGTLRVRWNGLCQVLLSSGATTERLQVLKDMNGSRGSLFNILKARRGLGVTDARDMIFGHMGIASDHAKMNASSVIVDYRSILPAVYENTARYLFETEGPGVMFSNMDDEDSQYRQKGLASWAPDWTLPQSHTLPMYWQNEMSNSNLHANTHYVFVNDPLVLAFMGYEFDVVTDVSMVLPDSSKLDPSGRERYQQAVVRLQALYHNVWWSGDSDGQYAHTDLRGKETEHEELCGILADEWLRIIAEDVPALSPSLPAEDVNSHTNFVPQLRTWLEMRAKEGSMMVNSAAGKMAFLMWMYLLPRDNGASVLSGRRLAATKSGRIGVVSRQARRGDVVVYLAGSLISVLLRKKIQNDTQDQELDDVIKRAFEEKDQDEKSKFGSYVTSFSQLFREKNVPVDHYTVAGECYIDGAVGWLKSTEQNHKYDHRIFAIR